MKKIYIGMAISVIVAALFYSGGAVQAQPAQTEMEICGVPTVVTLFAGQTIDAGTVTVANDENYLYVTFSTKGDWLLSETHLHVADSLANIPQTKKGNPKVGNFDYQRTYDPPVTSDTYVIPMEDLVFGEGNTLVIAAHAVVIQIDENGEVIESETGWADGDPFVDRGSWAMFFVYEWQDCNGGGDGGTETAFAFGGEYATCFLDLGFSRWGWTNGPLVAGSYSFDIYAGAGQCDLSKGTFVGTLEIEYDGSAATVTYLMAEGFALEETHLYIGSEILPMNNGEYTVAPGQYPSIHDVDSADSDSFLVEGLSGEIYVVAHAVVSGF